MHRIADQYGQEVRLLRLGRLPALIVIDGSGQIVSAHYGDSMRDHLQPKELLAMVRNLTRQGGPPTR